jgi:hypothetical protein
MNGSSKLQQIAGQAIRYWLPGNPVIENYRPEWLFGMELDFFFPQTNLAIEVQGRQHHLWSPSLQPTIEHFKKQRERDRAKRRICNERRILFLSIKDKGPELEILRRKLSNFVGHLSSTPVEIKKAWKEHCKVLSAKKWPAYKIKGGVAIPVNRVSARFAKGQSF